VGLTVSPLEPMPWSEAPIPPGVRSRPTRLGELMPVAARTAAECDAELERVAVVEGALAAYKAEIVARRARLSSAADDRKAGEPGAASPDWAPAPDDDPLPEVSEFFPDELAVTMNCSRAAAVTMADVSLTLVERLRATWAALADGKIDWPRARALAVELGWPTRECDPEVIAAVESAVLPGAMGLSVTRLKAAVQRELIARDAASAERRRKRKERGADVSINSLGDGMSELRAQMPTPMANATFAAIDSHARLAKSGGDPRRLGQLRAGVLADLALRPWDTSRPPVTAHVTVLAPLDALTGRAAAWHGASPFARPGPAAPVGEVDGRPITASQLRELLAQLDMLELRAPVHGDLTIAITDSDGTLRAAITRPQLERIVRHGCPDHPDGTCACSVLHRPAEVDRYRPSPGHYVFVHTRDRMCRFPGCGKRAEWADVDHVIAHAVGGVTDCCNLCCLCRRHHRLKTHASGWRFEMSPDGMLTVTTPTGVSRTTHPPGLDILREHLNPWGHSPPQPDEDPPPF
jgi:hypothetical protein